MSEQDDEKHRNPGELIQELLDARGWSQRVLAIVLDVGETGLNKVVAGKQPLTAELAIALEDLFSMPAKRFLALQKAWDLAQARLIARPDPGRATRARLFGGLPISDMIKRRWLDADDVRDVPQVESALARFFGVGSHEEIEILPHAAKKTPVPGDVTPTQLAWLYRVRQIASDMLVARYSTSGLRAAIKKLDALLSAPEEARKVPRILAEAGVRYVLVESLPGAKIDGVCTWLDSASPTVAMTCRQDRIDNFWFVLRHELEHALRGHGLSEIVIDLELEGERAVGSKSMPEQERVANEAAAEFCVPQRELDRLIARKSPLFAQRDILGFARTLGIHPGLVAGQLQHRTGRYDRFRSHQVKIRHQVAPSAIVDGWGDVAPVGL